MNTSKLTAVTADGVEHGATPLRRSLARPEWRSEYFPNATRGHVAIVAAVCGVFLLTSFNRLNHTDLWGHLAFGRYIVEHGAVPTGDPFSAAPSAERTVNTAWLSQVAGFATYQWLGGEGLVLMHALLIALACGLLIWSLRRQGLAAGYCVAAAITAYVLLLPIAGTIRPQLLGIALLPLVFVACQQIPRTRSVLLWLPALFILWANLHGSFAVGLAVLGLYCAGQSWDAWRRTGSLRATIAEPVFVRQWLALALSVAASCVHPAGPRLLLAVATFGGNPILDTISEWRPLVLESFSGVLFFTSLLATAVLLRVSPRRLTMWEVLTLLVLAAGSLSAIRMLSWWAIYWPFWAAPHAAAWWSARCEDSEATTAQGAPIRTLLCVALTFMTLLVAPPTHALLHDAPRGAAKINSPEAPIYVAEELARGKIEGRIFAPTDWGDYLIWKTGAAVRPLAYSHPHLLAPRVWSDHRRLAAGDPAWLQIADRYGLEYLVISRQRQPALLAAVKREPRTAGSIDYWDRQSVVVRISPPR